MLRRRSADTAVPDGSGGVALREFLQKTEELPATVRAVRGYRGATVQQSVAGGEIFTVLCDRFDEFFLAVDYRRRYFEIPLQLNIQLVETKLHPSQSASAWQKRLDKQVAPMNCMRVRDFKEFPLPMVVALKSDYKDGKLLARDCFVLETICHEHVAVCHTKAEGDEMDGAKNLVAIPLDTELLVVPLEADMLDHDYDQLWPEEEELMKENMLMRRVGNRVNLGTQRLFYAKIQPKSNAQRSVTPPSMSPLPAGPMPGSPPPAQMGLWKARHLSLSLPQLLSDNKGLSDSQPDLRNHALNMSNSGVSSPLAGHSAYAQIQRMAQMSPQTTSAAMLMTGPTPAKSTPMVFPASESQPSSPPTNVRHTNPTVGSPQPAVGRSVSLDEAKRDLPTSPPPLPPPRRMSEEAPRLHRQRAISHGSANGIPRSGVAEAGQSSMSPAPSSSSPPKSAPLSPSPPKVAAAVAPQAAATTAALIRAASSAATVGKPAGPPQTAATPTSPPPPPLPSRQKPPPPPTATTAAAAPFSTKSGFVPRPAAPAQKPAPASPLASSDGYDNAPQGKQLYGAALTTAAAVAPTLPTVGEDDRSSISSFYGFSAKSIASYEVDYEEPVVRPVESPFSGLLVADITVDRVGRALQQSNLSEYCAVFRRELVDGRALSKLTDGELEERFGVRMAVERQRILGLAACVPKE